MKRKMNFLNPRFGVASFAASKLKAGLRPAWQGKSLAFSTTKSGDFAEQLEWSRWICHPIICGLKIHLLHSFFISRTGN
ncbi:MAG: hypothetical protein LBT78_03140 [Tannerella sp.]|nr:hypothetical protein [Tannerella sp.]